jgi:hypothetical protein
MRQPRMTIIIFATVAGMQPKNRRACVTAAPLLRPWHNFWRWQGELALSEQSIGTHGGENVGSIVTAEPNGRIVMVEPRRLQAAYSSRVWNDAIGDAKGGTDMTAAVAN